MEALVKHKFLFWSQDNQFWKLYKEDPATCAIVMKTSVGIVYLLSTLLEPFMPSFSIEVIKAPLLAFFVFYYGYF